MHDNNTEYGLGTEIYDMHIYKCSRQVDPQEVQKSFGSAQGYLSTAPNKSFYPELIFLIHNKCAFL